MPVDNISKKKKERNEVCIALQHCFISVVLELSTSNFVPT